MVSTSYPKTARDWPGRFIADMVAHLGARPELKLAFWGPPGELPHGVESACIGDDSRWLADLSDRGGIAHCLKTGGIGAAGSVAGLLRRLRRLYRQRADADVVHVNWLQNALPLWGIRTPAVVTVLGADLGLLRLPGMTASLRAVFRQRRCILAPNAAWMAEPLQRAFAGTATVSPIPFGVAESWFRVEHRRPATRKWLAVTRITRAKLGTLLEWGDEYFRSGRELHLLGPMQDEIALPAWVHYHGAASPEDLRDRWFPEACGLVTLSAHDEGRPQVVLEAMAAGVPVIVSDLPAHRDIVSHGTTGWIATDRASFGEGLRQLEDSAVNGRIEAAAREWARAVVGTWADCAGRYVRAYSALGDSGAAPLLAQTG